MEAQGIKYNNTKRKHKFRMWDSIKKKKKKKAKKSNCHGVGWGDEVGGLLQTEETQ